MRKQSNMVVDNVKIGMVKKVSVVGHSGKEIADKGGKWRVLWSVMAF